MGKTLEEIAQILKSNDKKVKLIYAFNGVGKTRLSTAFKNLVSPHTEEDEGLKSKHILYYNAFTEDLFYWDNDLINNTDHKLLIQPNVFTNWVFIDQGQDNNIVKYFQRYTNDKLTPIFNEEYIATNQDGKELIKNAYSEVHFSYNGGNDENIEDVKISKGEESCFIWSVFYSLLSEVVEVLNIPEEQNRETDKFNNLEYVFIDDPVSSLDENHLIELAVDLAVLIKNSKSKLKFFITTHNPLCYNVLVNEFHDEHSESESSLNYVLRKYDNNEYNINPLGKNVPFSYHINLLKQIESVINRPNKIKKYHFNYLRNILEKTAIFLGYNNWKKLLPRQEGEETNPYYTRIINISSHSNISTEESVDVSENDKRVLKYIVEYLKSNYKFN